MERVEILDKLRRGEIDVLVGVNLLREGLDLPEVSLVAILDADKEGFLRNHRSLTQTIGRAARNLNGCAILYADRITQSMQQTIDETNRRREKQMHYNEEHHITPSQIRRAVKDIDAGRKVDYIGRAYIDLPVGKVAEDPVSLKITGKDLDAAIDHLRDEMEAAARKLDFVTAAMLRDQMLALESRRKDGQ